MSKVADKKPMSATRMRIILAILLIAILLGMGGGFYMAYTFLNKTATEVSEIQSQAKSSDAQLKHLISLQEQLKTYQSTIEKANQIVADSKSYQYQNQIINDLTAYGNKSGVPIVSFSFSEASAGSGGSGAGAAPANTPKPATQPTAETGSTPPAAAAPSIKSTTVSVQLGTDIQYNNLLHFIHLIEQNLTRMQIAELSISKGEGSSIGTQTLSIEVYIR